MALPHCWLSYATKVLEGVMMKRTVFTIGYEGAELNAFLATLTLAGVEHLLDIRDVPVCGKK